MKNSKSIKVKIAIVYIVLLGATLFSGGYIFKEMKRVTLPEQSVLEESNRIFLVSSAITNLYASENSSRNAMLTLKREDINFYYQQLDSISLQIEAIKKTIQDPYTVPKLDTVQMLLQQKKESFIEIIAFQKNLNLSENYDTAIKEVYDARKKIEQNHIPTIQITENKRKSLLSRLGQALRAEVPDTIKTTVNHPKMTDSLVIAMEKIFAEAQKKDHQLQRQLLLKEQSLLFENKTLTEQLRNILQIVEQNILDSSYTKINQSKTIIGNATKNIAWIGAAALITVILLGWIIINDINQTQKYRLKLEELNRDKEDLLRSKTMLLATVTHDIQTPLGSVLGFTELLAQTTLLNKQQKYIKNIQSSSEYIVKLVNDLVDFSKLENNKISIEDEIFNFKKLLNDTCYPLVPIAENKKIQLEWHIAETLNQNYISDPERIKQVLTNLITNAIKFTQVGGVVLDAKTEGAAILISVRDSGIGIEHNQLEYVFQEFRQAHEGIEKKFGGTGLGLTISQKIITLLGGTISVNSVLHEGSIFKVSLPQRLAHQVESIIPQNKEVIKHQDLLKDKRILVIDDDALQLQLAEEILSPLFGELILLNDATEAISTLESTTFDLVLTDIQMPKMDGFELIQQLREHSDFQNLPVIALSGKRNLSRADFQELGFTHSHPKPIAFTKLIEEIMGILFPNAADDYFNLEVSLQDSRPHSTKSYNLEQLIRFTGDNPDSLKKILVVFVESTQENLLDLQYAAEDLDLERLSDIAHKMIPMFKQLSMLSIVRLLETLEEQTQRFQNAEEATQYIVQIQDLTNETLTSIKNAEF